MEPSQTVLDQAQLDELRDDLGDAFGGFVNSFLGAMHAGLDELRGGLAAGDLTVVAKTAHRLKGSAGYLGTVALAQHLAELERLARDGEAAGAASQVDVLATAFAAVEPHLRALSGET